MSHVELFQNALGSIKLYQERALQPWNASDLLLLEQYALLSAESPSSTWVMNDHQGAIALSVASAFSKKGVAIPIVAYQDSKTAHLATSNNRALNGLPESTFQPIVQIDALLTDVAAPDWVLMRIPKNMDFFAHQVHHIWKKASPATHIIVAGMVKHLSPSLNAILNCYFERLDITHAKKKARGFIASVPRSTPLSLPESFEFQYCTPQGIALVNNSNGFSRRSLDIGCRFMLEHMPALSGRIGDLGCGNGALGLEVARTGNPNELWFLDDSFMAIEASQRNMAGLAPVLSQSISAHFIHSNVFMQCPADIEFDHILCNPPFHDQHRVGADIAHRMFSESHARLRAGGTLIVVANQHLGYKQALKMRFKRVTQLTQNRKFVILSAEK